MKPIDRLLSMLESVKRSGAGYYARCPAHDDKRGKLYVTEKDDGKVTVHCFVGCRSADVVSALGLTFADLFPPRVEIRRKWPPQAPQRPLRRHYDWNLTGYTIPGHVVWTTAVEWGLNTEYQAIRWGYERDRLYERYGPTLKPQPNLKDKPPFWARLAKQASDQADIEKRQKRLMGIGR